MVVEVFLELLLSSTTLVSLAFTNLFFLLFELLSYAHFTGFLLLAANEFLLFPHLSGAVVGFLNSGGFRSTPLALLLVYLVYPIERVIQLSDRQSPVLQLQFLVLLRVLLCAAAEFVDFSFVTLNIRLIDEGVLFFQPR